MKSHNWLKPIWKFTCCFFTHPPSLTTLVTAPSAQVGCEVSWITSLPLLKTNPTRKLIWTQSSKLIQLTSQPHADQCQQEQAGGNIPFYNSTTPDQLELVTKILPSAKLGNYIIVLQICLLLTTKQDNAYSVISLLLVTLSSTIWFFPILNFDLIQIVNISLFYIHRTLGIRFFHSTTIQIY